MDLNHYGAVSITFAQVLVYFKAQGMNAGPFSFVARSISSLKDSSSLIGRILQKI
jgi:hypothetical protein